MQLPSDAMTSHMPAGVRGSQVEGSVNELKHEHKILTESKYLVQSKESETELLHDFVQEN